MDNLQIIAVAGKDALAELDRLRAKSLGSGLYPILLGDAQDKETALEFMEEGLDPSEILQQSMEIEAPEWFEETSDLDPESYEEDDDEWPEKSDKEMGIITHLDIRTRKPKKEVFIAMLKLSAPWEAFAYLNWGNWNDCPEPAVHCAIHRYWASRYGAEVVSITHDIVQTIVARPPADRNASMRLAAEQFIYCNDIVTQGTETIGALAAGLLNSKYWYFWWD